MKIVTTFMAVLVSLAFSASGVAKLMGVPETLMAFDVLGLPGWFPVLLAVCYLAGVVLLWIPSFAALAAAGFTVVMIGAVGYHVVYTPLIEALPAAILLVFSVVLFLQNRSKGFWVK